MKYRFLKQFPKALTGAIYPLPATRAAPVRFPDDTTFYLKSHWVKITFIVEIDRTRTCIRKSEVGCLIQKTTRAVLVLVLVFLGILICMINLLTHSGRRFESADRMIIISFSFIHALVKHRKLLFISCTQTHIHPNAHARS